MRKVNRSRSLIGRFAGTVSSSALRGVAALFDAPFADLLFRAQGVHHQHFDPNRVQLAPAWRLSGIAR